MHIGRNLHVVRRPAAARSSCSLPTWRAALLSVRSILAPRSTHQSLRPSRLYGLYSIVCGMPWVHDLAAVKRAVLRARRLLSAPAQRGLRSRSARPPPTPRVAALWACGPAARVVRPPAWRALVTCSSQWQAPIPHVSHLHRLCPPPHWHSASHGPLCVDRGEEEQARRPRGQDSHQRHRSR